MIGEPCRSTSVPITAHDGSEDRFGSKLRDQRSEGGRKEEVVCGGRDADVVPIPSSSSEPASTMNILVNRGDSVNHHTPWAWRGLRTLPWANAENNHCSDMACHGVLDPSPIEQIDQLRAQLRELTVGQALHRQGQWGHTWRSST